MGGFLGETMPTIAEIIAAKKAKANTPGKPKSLVLTTKPAEPQQDAEGYPPAWLTKEPRSLSMTAGEGIDQTPSKPTTEVALWHQALNSLDTELCIIRDRDEPEVCWLAVTRPAHLPILLHRLPWIFREAPHVPTDTEPF